MGSQEQKNYTPEEFFAIAAQSEERLELIDGEIICLAAPNKIHQDIIFLIHHQVFEYIRRNKGKCSAVPAPFDVVLGDDWVQPDFMVICNPFKMTDKRCIGAPDWVVEVVSSDTQRDYVKKLALYQEAGVREYWIIDPSKKRVFVYFFEESENVIHLYHWSDQIPVRIYQEHPGPLTICMEELLQLLP